MAKPFPQPRAREQLAPHWCLGGLPAALLALIGSLSCVTLQTSADHTIVASSTPTGVLPAVSPLDETQLDDPSALERDSCASQVAALNIPIGVATTPSSVLVGRRWSALLSDAPKQSPPSPR